MQGTAYHMLLRTSAAVCALVLLFDSGIVSPLTRSLSDNTISYLANSVGVYAGVESTKLSDMTAELREREQALTAREQALERQIASRDFGDNTASTDYSTYILSTILFVLVVLIVLNYALDWSRSKRMLHAAANT